MTLQVNKNSNWQATVSRFGGVVVPTGGSNAATIVDTQPQPLGVCTSNNQPPGVATIQSVEWLKWDATADQGRPTFNLRRQRMGSVNWLVPHHSYQCPD